MEDEFEKYEALKHSGASAEAACMMAASDGQDFAFQIRMLRAVFETDIGIARDIAAKVLLKS